MRWSTSLVSPVEVGVGLGERSGLDLALVGETDDVVVLSRSLDFDRLVLRVDFELDFGVEALLALVDFRELERELRDVVTDLEVDFDRLLRDARTEDRLRLRLRLLRETERESDSSPEDLEDFRSSQKMENEPKGGILETHNTTHVFQRLGWPYGVHHGLNPYGFPYRKTDGSLFPCTHTRTWWI